MLAEQSRAPLVCPWVWMLVPVLRQAFLAPPLDAEQRMVLVCTDRASRGIDSAHVEHVVGSPSLPWSVLK